MTPWQRTLYGRWCSRPLPPGPSVGVTLLTAPRHGPPRSLPALDRLVRRNARRHHEYFRRCPPGTAVQWPPEGSLLHRACAAAGTGTSGAFSQFQDSPDDAVAFLRWAAAHARATDRALALVRELGLEADLLALEVVES